MATAQLPPATDDLGFVNSQARCDATQVAFAMGRTRSSQLVICGDHTGNFEYRGVRLRDGATLKVPADFVGDGFVARKDTVTYAISRAELLVTSGDTGIKREPMIEYKEQHSPAEASPSMSSKPNA